MRFYLDKPCSKLPTPSKPFPHVARRLAGKGDGAYHVTDEKGEKPVWKVVARIAESEEGNKTGCYLDMVNRYTGGVRFLLLFISPLVLLVSLTDQLGHVEEGQVAFASTGSCRWR